MKLIHFSHLWHNNSVGLILWLFIALSFTPTKAQNPVDAEDCTKQFFEAIIEKNLINLNEVLAPDFTITGMDGQIIDRDTFITSIKNDFISVQTGIVDGIRVKNYLEVSAVSGRWNIQANIANSRYFGDVAFLAICIKQGAHWKVSTIQFTPII